MKSAYCISLFLLTCFLARSQSSSALGFYLPEFENKYAGKLLKTYFNKHLIKKKVILRKNDSRVEYQIASVYSDSCAVKDTSDNKANARIHTKHTSCFGNVSLTIYETMRCNHYEYCMFELNEGTRTLIVLFKMDLETHMIFNKLKTIIE